MVVGTSTCGYRDEDWPTNHSCLRHTGHPNRHKRWCEETHNHRSDSGLAGTLAQGPDRLKVAPKTSSKLPIIPEDRHLVETFWRDYVDGFFNDLENCIRLAHANYLVALGEMCYIDFLGKLMTGVQGPENFKTFIRTYLKTYATNPLNAKDATFLDRLYGEFRSGLVHSYFPKNVDVVAVMKVLPQPPSIWIDPDSGKWRIVVADFLDEFKKAADALKTDLLAGRYLAEFKRVVSESPGLGISAGMTSTTVTTVSGFVVPPPTNSPE